MKESEIVIAVFPQSNGTLKRRPALILREMPPFRDFLICGISTQLRQQVKGFDEIISEADEDFAASGLDFDSLIRLGFLLVVPRNEIIGSIGEISAERHQRLLKNLSDYLMKSS
ncbi:MAG: type II toxin-antitoxin system PemK/MazF family toxin [Pyrinomonadaceae bacterium]|nr:type II toxin-antitoxin system PemK/MazF family toxin [Pyrinomonadaceae bacterium]